MRNKTPITQITRQTTLTVQSTDRISAVYRLMKGHALAHISVMEHNNLVGIISFKSVKQLGLGYEFDGLDDIETGIFDMLQANQVMERDIPQIALSATVGEVAELMATRAFTALPTVAEGKPVGTVDINDIVLFLLKA